MLTDFEDYNREVVRFEKSKLYQSKYDRLMVLLPTGRDRVIISGELERALDCRGSEIRSLVRHARLKGRPVASCGKGYYLAESWNEIKDTVAHLEERARMIQVVADSLKGCFSSEPQGALEL